MTTLADLARRAHERYAEHPAVYDGETRMTFAELGAMARRTANRLLAHGLRPGDRVVLASVNRAEFLAVEHALFLTGLVRVALSSRLHGREIAGIARDCEAAAVICESEHAAAMAGQRRHPPSVRLVVADTGGDTTLAELTGPGASETAPEVPAPAAEDVAALMYTSGTTGEPKGAIVTHGGWLAMVRAFWAELPPCGPGDVVLHAAPMSHFGGSAGSAYTFRGAAVLPVRRFDPERVLRLVGHRRVTALPLVPTMLKALAVAAEAAAAGAEAAAADDAGSGSTSSAGLDLSSLRAVPYGGSAISAPALARARAAFGPVLYQCYGLSEALAPVTLLAAAEHAYAPGADLPRRLASAGRPVPEMEVSVVGEDGTEVPRGSVGEVRLRGEAVMPGYWNRPEETAQVLGRDGWFHTGDIGHFDEDGYLYLVDRRRDVIVSGGFNIYPSEVERAIAEHPAVHEVVVFPVPHEKWGEAVGAVVVPHAGEKLTAGDVVDACRARLASYKKPLHVEFADELPLSATGKLLRREIRDRHWAAAERRVGQ